MNRNRAALAGAGCLLAVIALSAGAGAAAGHAARAEPTAVRIVDLSRLMDGLDQRSEADMALDRRRGAMTTEAQTREREINELNTRLKAATDPRERESLAADIDLRMLKHKASLTFDTNTFDIDQALYLKQLYGAVKSAIRDLALAEGYDLVVVDDAGGEITWEDKAPMTRQAQVVQQVSSRRVLFAAPTIDITEALITRMNNAFRTGKT